MKKLFRSLLIIPLTLGLFTGIKAQDISPTSPQELASSVKKRAQMAYKSLLRDYPVRSVGPVIMSGRVTDIAVHPDNPRIFYTGFGSGGVFKTSNSGNTMEPIFDHQMGALGVGDLAISRANPEVIWVGTGENNSSRSTYAGTGVYRSEDGGNTWEHKGLWGTHHIARIVTHPTDENIAWVASVGNLYSKNDDRGVFKTTDGGITWEKYLFLNDSTGVIDLIIHPENPDILWAATWEKDRKAWNFVEGGNGSGIYKSVDGGKHWEELTNGLPTGNFVGRIGLDISQSDPDVIYAVIDNQYETKTEIDQNPDGLTQNDLVKMSKKSFLKLDDKELNSYLRNNRFPKEYDAERVKADVKSGKYEPRALSDYLGDANDALFNTEIIGTEVYRSNDGGEHWEKVNSYDLDNVYYTYGYYFGQIRVDPNDPETIYIWGVPFLKSTDGGKTWTPKAENQNIHVDHHALWIDPSDSEHLLLGNDGGLYESHDGGENFIHHNTVAVGQFYTVAVDMEEPYNIYGGLQDNGTYFGPSTSTPNRERPWTRLSGGDGMHVAVHPENSSVIYAGFQYGNYFRIDPDNSFNRITPSHDVGEPRYRFNWNTPMNMSHHNPEIIYLGSQRLNRSLDGGKTWTAISPDLTNDLPNGDVPYSTLTSVAESPLAFNIIWAGTDDGNVQLTIDGGASWELVSESLPQGRWVSEVHASSHDEATAFVSLNGYRFDEFKTYVYKTTDFGKSWSSVKGDLPEDVVNVIIQDPVNPDILYTGLDHGTYVSLNGGKNWHYLSDMPNVASYDMLVHPRDLELVIGTHGRSVWVADVSPLHTLADRLDEKITAIKPESIRYSGRWGTQSVAYREPYMPSVDLMYYLSDEGDDQNVTLDISDKDGKVIKTLKLTGHQGINTTSWDLVLQKDDDGYTFLTKGTYTLTFKKGRNSHAVELEIK